MNVLALVLLALTGGLGYDDAADAAKKDLEKLQGEWQLTVGGDDGPRMVIKGNEYTVSGGMDEKGTLKLDPSKKPAVVDIDITEGNDKGKKQYGIYRIEGDKFTLCVAEAGAEADDRPKEFKSDQDAGTAVLVFKRVKK